MYNTIGARPSVHEESGLYVDNLNASTPIQDRLEDAFEAINITKPQEIKNFKNIPGLTSYNDFLKEVIV